MNVMNLPFGHDAQAVALFIAGLKNLKFTEQDARALASLCTEAGFIGYERPEMCVDAPIFWSNNICYVKRRNGTWSCVGGFLESHVPAMETAMKKHGDYGFEFTFQMENKQEANLHTQPCIIIGESSKPGRDERFSSVPTVIVAGVCENPRHISAGDDVVDAQWVPFIKNGVLNKRFLTDTMHADIRGIFQKIYAWYIRNKQDKETVEQTLRRIKYLNSPLSYKEVDTLAASHEPEGTTFFIEAFVNFLEKKAHKFPHINHQKLGARYIVEQLVEAGICRRWGQYATAVDVLVIRGNRLLVQNKYAKPVLPGRFLRVYPRAESFNDTIDVCLDKELGLRVEGVHAYGPVVRMASGFNGDPRMRGRNAIAKPVFVTDGEKNIAFVNWLHIFKGQPWKRPEHEHKFFANLNPEFNELDYDHLEVVRVFYRWLMAHNPHDAKISVEQLIRKLII